MNITGHYVEVDHVLAYVEEIGEGQPILMLPSAGRDSRMWHGVMKVLSNEYRTIAVDLPGHGKSWPLRGPKCLTTGEEAADFVDGLLDALGFEKIILTGFSLGGNLSLFYGGTRPERCQAIIALEAADHSPTHSPEWLALLEHPRVSPSHYLMGQATTVIGPNIDEPTREFNEWYGHQMSGINVRADLSIFSTIDSRPFLKSISCPVLMLRGEFDWIVPKDRVDNTAAKLAETTHLEYETLHGVGHFPPLEAPELVGSLMAKFLHENL